MKLVEVERKGKVLTRADFGCLRGVPTLNVTALNLAYLIGGVVIVEKVFSYPGFGSLLVDALQLRDLPLIEATVLIAAAVYVGANLLADTGAILLNPRLRAG